MNRLAQTRQRLVREDPHFQRLVRRHREYEKRLEQLRDLRYPNIDEQMEEVKLKKLKLSIKDQMERLVRDAAS